MDQTRYSTVFTAGTLFYPILGKTHEIYDGNNIKSINPRTITTGQKTEENLPARNTNNPFSINKYSYNLLLASTINQTAMSNSNYVTSSVNKTKSMKTKLKKPHQLYILLFFLVSSYLLNSQTENTPVNFASPNAATLGLYGTIPVSHFTGIPNINVPLYTIEDGNIKVPLNLSYHLSAVKVNAHPGWTGLGWSLSSGGAITREVKGIMDEYKKKEGLSTVGGGDLGFYFLKNDGGLELNTNDWDLRLRAHAYNSSHFQRDMMSDNFHFNFLGYSGSFYLNENYEWTVKSKHNIKVIFEEENEGMVSQEDLRYPLTRNTNLYSYDNDFFFNKFTLVTDDGTKYKFGGLEATEYSVPWGTDRNGNRSIDTKIVPTTWNLVEIETLNGDKITFEYESTYGADNKNEIVCALSESFYYKNYSTEGVNCGIEKHQNFKVFGDLIFPVYLKRIVSNTSIVEFERSISMGLRYDAGDFLFLTPDDPKYFDTYEDLQWKQLDEIKIKNTNGDLIKSFSFDYNTDGTNNDIFVNDNPRLKLLAVNEHNTLNEDKITHSFEYNPMNMPGNYLSRQIDHWGFYNGYDGEVLGLNGVAATQQEFYRRYKEVRQPTGDVDTYKAETLEKIIYPTGGYTLFEYEQNDCRAIVDENRDEALELRYAKSGGLRIKKIASYPSVDSGPVIKEYLYRKDYTSNRFLSLSSGVQNSKHIYYWDNYSMTNFGQEYIVKKASSVSSYPNPFNSMGTSVGYTEVVEKTRGNGYQIYTYTNYDNGFKDEKPIVTTNMELTPLRSFSSTSTERGNIASIKTYNEDDVKVKEEIFSYERSSNDYVRSVDVSVEFICDNLPTILNINNPINHRPISEIFDLVGTAYKRYVYNFNLIRKETKTYDVHGLNETVSIEEYKYNDQKLMSQTKTWDSQDNEIVTTYAYPFDYPSDTGMTTAMYDGMIDSGLLNPVIKNQTTINSKVITTDVMSYQSFLGNYYPGIIKESKADQDLETTLWFTKYTPKGQPREVRLENEMYVVYLWGYDDNYPIAKIENAYYGDIIVMDGLYDDIISKSDLDNKYGTEQTEANLRNSFKNLRDALPDSFVTSYTYDPLIGVTSITDPKGYTTYYSYDEFNRLKYVKDAKEKILSQYKYNYKNQ